MEEEKNPKIPWWQPGLALFARLSAWIAAPVILAVFVGKYLDQKMHTTPWIFLLCVACAFTFSMVMIVKIGLKEMNK